MHRWIHFGGMGEWRTYAFRSQMAKVERGETVWKLPRTGQTPHHEPRHRGVDEGLSGILPTLGHLQLVELTPAHVQTLYAAKFDAGYALSTRRHIHVTLGKALKQAVKWHYLTTSPTAGAEVTQSGNLVGTLLYFLWFNLGLIALIFPVRVAPLVVRLDWPYLIGVTWLATLFFARGQVGRAEGLLLVGLYGAYRPTRRFKVSSDVRIR